MKAIYVALGLVIVIVGAIVGTFVLLDGSLHPISNFGHYVESDDALIIGILALLNGVVGGFLVGYGYARSPERPFKV